MAQDPFGNQVNSPRFEPPRFPPGVLRLAVMLAVFVLLALNSFYQVEPEEVGVVLRLGVYQKSSPPGLHFKIPVVDQVWPVPVQRQLTESFPQQPGTGGRGQHGRDGGINESNMLTGDLNTAVVTWVVQYRIVDPVAYLFKVRNARETFRDMSEAVMREVVGDRTVNEVITVGRQEIKSVVEVELQQLSELYEIGIQVDQVLLQDVTPPEPVKPAFNEVNQAEQERSQLISEAQSEYNKVIPRAKGEAQQTILGAEGYALDRVNRAQGEAARFTAVYEEYRKAPEVTRKRIYLETLRRILPKVGRKVVIDEKIRGVIPLLNLEGGQRGLLNLPQEGGQ